MIQYVTLNQLKDIESCLKKQEFSEWRQRFGKLFDEALSASIKLVYQYSSSVVVELVGIPDDGDCLHMEVLYPKEDGFFPKLSDIECDIFIYAMKYSAKNR